MINKVMLEMTLYEGLNSLEIYHGAYLFNLICDDIKDFEIDSISKNLPNVVDAIDSLRFNACKKKIEKFVLSQKTKSEIDRYLEIKKLKFNKVI
jgi:hypothetical protein